MLRKSVFAVLSALISALDLIIGLISFTIPVNKHSVANQVVHQLVATLLVAPAITSAVCWVELRLIQFQSTTASLVAIGVTLLLMEIACMLVVNLAAFRAEEDAFYSQWFIHRIDRDARSDESKH